ncbi:GLPGLI family protein [Chryseobacterium scophthalmum]|uniref:GLPGLI family protein n=1 Tax=Chryseobacterium scophthalmum TaxID=59733 RepID=A0A1N6HP61_9FLAO|nr:GLPGLI family protein [Chryseobacterium scophthalmum]SIO21604.1 GLPGLI family protein [Chryseobacterium scophthalmum]
MKIVNKISLVCSVMFFAFSFSQNIKVTYKYMPSDVFEFEENVYLNNNYKVSIIDSIPVKRYKENKVADVYIEQDKGIKQYRTILMNDLKNNNIFFTYQIKKINYLVSDTPPVIKWNLKHKETKKIGKYICKKATAVFRGTDIEAYYTTEIPVSVGPYKFKGLPGLILEVRTLGINPMSWRVKNVQFPYKGTPNYSKKFVNSLKKIDIKELIKKIDDRNDEDRRIFHSKLNLPMPAKVEVTGGNPRGVVENKFEWEK